MSRYRQLLVVPVVIFATSSTRADVFISPLGFETVEGSGRLNSSPFNFGGGASRYYQMFDAAQFSSLGPILISGIRYRPDQTQNTAFSDSFTNVEFRMSTSTVQLSNMMSQFDSNTGNDVKLVRSGTLTVSTNNITTLNGTKEFDIFIPFTDTFLYDPNKGNLTLDIRTFSAGNTGFIDWHSDTSSEFVRDIFFDGSATAIDGGLGIGGGVTQFEFILVPEPTAFALLLAGTCLMSRRCRIICRAH